MGLSGQKENTVGGLHVVWNDEETLKPPITKVLTWEKIGNFAPMPYVNKSRVDIIMFVFPSTENELLAVIRISYLVQ